ncbi:MAG: AAA family ATPase [Cytophagales bacterium]|nr:AAA family ATPase [Cytophagales bacterium]
MIGRSESLGHLQRLLHESRQGKARVALLSGPAGIGKSTLLAELFRQTPSLFSSQYHYFESITSPYAPLVHALRELAAQLVLPSAESSPSDHSGVLLPELKGESPVSDKKNWIDVFRQVVSAAAARQPVCLVLEDCHWADAATLELLPALVEGVQHLPLTWLLTYRSDSIPRDHPMVKLRAHLRRLTGVSELKLPLLSEAETALLVEQQLDEPVSPSFTALIYAQTQGLPFFVKELTKALQSRAVLVRGESGLALADNGTIPIPESVRVMIALQLDGIAGNTRETLELAALLGQEFPLELLSDLLNNDQAIDDLLTSYSSVLSTKDTRTGVFSHALVREVIRQDTPWSRRKQFNCRIAAALEARQAPAEQVGLHWLEGGDKLRARECFVEASRVYCRLHAHTDAVRTAQLALELWPKGQQEAGRLAVLTQLAACTRVSNQVQHSILALREMLESPLLREDHARLGETYRALALSYALQGTWLHYKQCRQKAAESFEKAQGWAEAVQDWHELANRHLDEMDVTAGLEASERAVLCARQAGKTDLEAKALAGKGFALAVQGKSTEGKQLLQEAILLARDHVEASAYVYRKLAAALEYLSEYTGSLQAYESALNYCRRENLDQQSQFCLTCMSWILFRVGDWKRSLEVCKEYLDGTTPNAASQATGCLITGLIRGLRGEIKTAQQYLRDAAAFITESNFHVLDPLLYGGIALLEEYEDRPEGAYQHYTRLFEHWEKTGDVHDVLPGFCNAIAFFVKHNYREESHRTVQILSAIASLTGNAEAVGVLSFALGEMARAEEQYHEAQLHYNQSLRAFRELSIPLQVLTVLIGKSKAYLAAGDKRAAREALEQAMQLARSLGARPCLSALNTLLEQTTTAEAAHFPVLAPSPGSLTERQSEILTALVQGLSNKEIAARHLLSTRTVDMHVRNIFDRLNCRTRAEAVRIAVEKKLVQPLRFTQ